MSPTTENIVTHEQPARVREIHTSQAVGMAGDNQPTISRATVVLVGRRVYMTNPNLCILPEFMSGGWPADAPSWRQNVARGLRDLRRSAVADGAHPDTWVRREVVA